MSSTTAEIEAKRAARALKKQQQSHTTNLPTQPFLERQVHALTTDALPNAVSVLSWNILAQALIRRKLFPGCDGLRWNQRSQLMHQVLHYSPDLVCLQEVDRIEDHAKSLQSKYDYVYEKGYESKQHGLVIAWRRDKFHLLKKDCVKFDELEVSPGRKALSRRTRNIGLVAALRHANPDDGVILATCHLFWHPRYVYERARQVALFLRFLKNFQASCPDAVKWPIVIAGDFNIQPSEVSYWLTVSDTEPLPEMRQVWEQSRVVHESLDEVPHEGQEESSEKEEEEEEDEDEDESKENDLEKHPDRTLANCRPCTEKDDLLTWLELQDAYRILGRKAVSLYDRRIEGFNDQEHFGQRRTTLTGQSATETLPGDFEPIYTNFTPLCEPFFGRLDLI